MSDWGSSATAQAVRDIAAQVTRNVLTQERPPPRYATVVTIDRPGRMCTVTYIGGTAVVPVAMGSVQPASTGQKVRINGMAGDRYIDAVLGDHYVAPIDHGTGLTGLADDDHPQYVLKAGSTMTGPLVLPVGAIGAPSLRFDADTGIYSSGADKIDFTAGGVRRLGINAATPHVEVITGAGATDNGLRVYPSIDATSERASIRLGDWIVGQDFLTDGTKDFFIHDVTAGAVRFRLDTAGRMYLPAQPYFLLRHSSTITVADATTVDHPWNVEVNDNSGFHEGSDAFVTVPVSGLYYFGMSTHADSAVTAGSRQCFFLVGNSDPADGNNNRWGGDGVGPARGTTSGFAVVSAQAIIPLTAGQTVHTKVYQTTGASQTWGVASRRELNFFTGCLLWRF